MPPETELIKQQMEQTRVSLSEKLETLENKVFGTIHDTSGVISDTVQQVGSTVCDTVKNVGSTVRETNRDVRTTVSEAMASARDAVNLSRQMQEHPWLMLGSSVFAGYVGGLLLENLERGHVPSLPSLPATPEQLLPRDSEVRERMESASPARRSSSSFLRGLVETFAPELDKLKRVALGAAVGLVRDKVSESVPAHMRDDIASLMDRVAQKLGGEAPPPGAMYGAGESEHDERNGAERARSMGIG